MHTIVGTYLKMDWCVGLGKAFKVNGAQPHQAGFLVVNEHNQIAQYGLARNTESYKEQEPRLRALADRMRLGAKVCLMACRPDASFRP